MADTEIPDIAPLDATPTPLQPAAQPAQNAPDTRNATISLVTGILSVLIGFVGIILGIAAIIYWRKQKKIAPNGAATAGMILGIVGILANLFLLLLVLFGAIAYFGVLPPDKLLPDRCTANQPFSCVEYQITASGVSMTLWSNPGVDVQMGMVYLQCSGGPEMVASSIDPPSGTIILNGAKVNVRWDSIPEHCITDDGRISATFRGTYSKVGETVTHEFYGELQGRVQ